jgi:hypothetical protein
MAWITLSLRKQSLQSEVNGLNNEDVQLSRQQRAVHRHLSYEESVFDTKEKADLRKEKAAYLEIRDNRPDIDSKEYEDWKQKYAAAQEDYMAKKQDIQDYYDGVREDIESEAQDEEDRIQEQITRTETQRDAMSAELQSLTDQIKTEVQSEAIKF